MSSGYYAMLYAARAALSERDLSAKTHRGTWSEFSRAFIAEEAIDAEIGRLGSKVQRVREQADYEAEELSHEEAQAVLADAERFVAAVGALLD